MAMANNGISSQLQGAATHNNMAYGAMAAAPKGPILDRYHTGSGDEHGWTKSKGKKNNGIALSALTLLAFLFFLNILQNCLQDHTEEMKGKGKGYYLQPSFNIQIPVPMMTQGRSEVQLANLKGDSGETDNSLEIDDLTGEEAEGKHVPNIKNVKRRVFTKKSNINNKNNKIQKVNTLYNVNDD